MRAFCALLPFLVAVSTSLVVPGGHKHVATLKHRSETSYSPKVPERHHGLLDNPDIKAEIAAAGGLHHPSKTSTSSASSQSSRLRHRRAHDGHQRTTKQQNAGQALRIGEESCPIKTPVTAESLGLANPSLYTSTFHNAASLLQTSPEEAVLDAIISGGGMYAQPVPNAPVAPAPGKAHHSPGTAHKVADAPVAPAPGKAHHSPDMKKKHHAAPLATKASTSAAKAPKQKSNSSRTPPRFEKIGISKLVSDTGGFNLTMPSVDRAATPYMAVDLPEKDVFLKVYKDSFSQLGCYHDLSNVSVVRYSELVAEGRLQAMTPEVCFDFCKTVPGMDYFGIDNGKECYCTPFFETDGVSFSSTAEDGNCDLPCKGDDSQMCGGRTRASVFEMHVCQDTLQELSSTVMVAAKVLQAFYEQESFSEALARELEQSGDGLSSFKSSRAAQSLGEEAKNFSGVLRQVLANATCKQAYGKLLSLYVEAEEIVGLNFLRFKNTERADASIQDMGLSIESLRGCLKTETLLSSKNYYRSFLESPSREVYQAHMRDQASSALPLFAPLMWAIQDQPEEAKSLSICEGASIGEVMALSFPECADLCRHTAAPQGCVGFQFVRTRGEEQRSRPLCRLFSDITGVTAYNCSQEKAPRKLGLLSDAQGKKPVSWDQSPERNRMKAHHKHVVSPRMARVLARAGKVLGDGDGEKKQGLLTFGSTISLAGVSSTSGETSALSLETCGWSSDSSGYGEKFCNEQSFAVRASMVKQHKKQHKKLPQAQEENGAAEASQWYIFGKPAGEPVLYGDQVLLRSRKNLPTRCETGLGSNCSDRRGGSCSRPSFLDTCSLAEEYDSSANSDKDTTPATPGSSGLCATPDRGDSTRWTIRGGPEGSYVVPGSSVQFESKEQNGMYLAMLGGENNADGSSGGCRGGAAVGLQRLTEAQERHALESLSGKNSSKLKRTMVDAAKRSLWQWSSSSLVGSTERATPQSCDSLRQFVSHSGLSCREIWGEDAEIYEACPDVCKHATSQANAAMCSIRSDDAATLAKKVATSWSEGCLAQPSATPVLEASGDKEVVTLPLGDEGIFFSSSALERPWYWTPAGP